MTKETLKQASTLVKEILEEEKTARNNDMFLYLKVCEKINPEALQLPITTLLLSLKQLGLPCPETVRRARQKIQSENPHLASNKRIAKLRAENETIYREFATERVG